MPTTGLGERLHSAGQKRDQWFTLQYYEGTSCQGDPFLETGMGKDEDKYTGSGCLNNMKDPYTQEDKCVRSVRVNAQYTWNSTNVMDLTLRRNADCSDIITDTSIWFQPGQTYCQTVEDTDCVRSVQALVFGYVDPAHAGDSTAGGPVATTGQ